MTENIEDPNPTQQEPTKESPALPCCPPHGDSGEEYYCKRDDFVRYIEDEVNPAREKCNLRPLDMKTAEECYRILNDFARQWGCNPIGDNVKGESPPPESAGGKQNK